MRREDIILRPNEYFVSGKVKSEDVVRCWSGVWAFRRDSAQWVYFGVGAVAVRRV